MKLLFTLLLSVQFLSAQVWMPLSNYPGLKRDDGVAVVVGNKAYVGTGLVEFALTLDFWVMDLSNYTWSYGKAMPDNSNRQYSCAFAGEGCYYVFGGIANGGANKDLYKYDVASNSWSSVAAKPGNGISGAACMNFGDKVIISGGKFQNDKASAEVWEYTKSTDTWLQKNDYPFAGRWRASAAVLNNAGYLIFGRDTGGAFRKEFYKYTPSTDTWTKIMDFPGAKGRNYSSLNVAHGKLTVFGGVDTLDTFYKDIWYFNEATTSWLQGPDLPAAGRKGGMSWSYGEDLFYTCGIAGGSRVTETWKTDVPVGIKKNQPESLFSVYPNPTNEKINIEVPSRTFATLTCNYEDVFGRALGTLNLNSEREIDLSNLNTGIYFLKFFSENGLIETKKIIKN